MPDPVPIYITDPISVRKLAGALAKKPHAIINDLTTHGRFGSHLKNLIPFATAAPIVRGYEWEPQKRH